MQDSRDMGRVFKDIGMHTKYIDGETSLDRLKLFGLEDKYDQLMAEIRGHGSFNEYMNHRIDIQNRMEDEVKNSDGYKNIGHLRFNVGSPFPSSSPYSTEHEGKRLISVDLSDANFQILRHHGVEPLLGFESYKEWIADYTEDSHLIDSKHLRQVIFGKLNPKKTTQLQKLLMTEFAVMLKDKYKNFVDIITINNDEVVFTCEGDSVLRAVSETTYDFFHNEKGLEYSIDAYYLYHIPSVQSYLKVYDGFGRGDEMELKKVPAHMYALVYRLLHHGYYDDESDVIFMFENKYKSKLLSVDNIVKDVLQLRSKVEADKKARFEKAQAEFGKLLERTAKENQGGM